MVLSTRRRPRRPPQCARALTPPRAARKPRSQAPRILFAALLLLPLIQMLRTLPPVHNRRHSENNVAFEQERRQQAVKLNATLWDTVSRDVSWTSLSSAAPREARYAPEVMGVVNVHAVVSCHAANPCCYATVGESLAALRGSVMPERVSIVHACGDDVGRLNAVAEGVVGGEDGIEVELVACGEVEQGGLDECSLKRVGDVEGEFVLVLSEREVIERTALEKSWLYLKLRNVSMVRMVGYDEGSLYRAREEGDAMVVKRVMPKWGEERKLSPLPMLIRRERFAGGWDGLKMALGEGRILKEALFTFVTPDVMGGDVMANDRAMRMQGELPWYLRSEVAYWKYVSERDEQEQYKTKVESVVDLSPLGDWKREGGRHVLLVVPWLQMGGSEKAMLDLAERIIELKWQVSVVLTMAEWKEDELGELGLRNEWLDRMLMLTSDVFNLVTLSPHENMSRAFRYILETRRPEFVLLANTRWAYAHSALIRTVVPTAVVADMNHMVHMFWEGGGLPRYGANYSRYFDVHFAASQDVKEPMERWIEETIMKRRPDKVRACHIGTDARLFYQDEERTAVNRRMRQTLGVSERKLVVLFAGRFVPYKGLDVMQKVVEGVARDKVLGSRIVFVFVGDGEQRYQLHKLQSRVNVDGKRVMVLRPPAHGLKDMKEYYAMADVLLLPSASEGIALVVYEAMAAGVLVMTTDVGGQREVVTKETGVLLMNKGDELTKEILITLRHVLRAPLKYLGLVVAAKKRMAEKFTTRKFCDCVINGLVEAKQKGVAKVEEDMERLGKGLVKDVEMERSEAEWLRDGVGRRLDRAVTIGIKTYTCDANSMETVKVLVRSIRMRYPTVRVLLGNDGPISLEEEEFVRGDRYTEEVRLKGDSGISYGRNRMVDLATTRYFVSLDDDQELDLSTDLGMLVRAIQMDKMDLVGMRVRNLPGMTELEKEGRAIPRYVGLMEGLRNRTLTLCVWNENDGPSVYGLRHAIMVDVVHNAFMAKTEMLRRFKWREELEVNEHMTFFLDAKRAGVKVGYLPSVFVHHRKRRDSSCYHKVRFREDKFAKILDYDERLLYDVACGEAFPNRVRQHVLKFEFDA